MKKPMIRHCANCEYGKIRFLRDVDCLVRYEIILSPRLRALFCRFYREKVE